MTNKVSLYCTIVRPLHGLCYYYNNYIHIYYIIYIYILYYSQIITSSCQMIMKIFLIMIWLNLRTVTSMTSWLYTNSMTQHWTS